MFLFRQETSYEMRISDWSSDVCSSDRKLWRGRDCHRVDCGFRGFGVAVCEVLRVDETLAGVPETLRRFLFAEAVNGDALLANAGGKPGEVAVGRRSEEHTSELQSLMRISYAVFCLNKKKTTQAKGR